MGWKVCKKKNESKPTQLFKHKNTAVLFNHIVSIKNKVLCKVKKKNKTVMKLRNNY